MFHLFIQKNVYRCRHKTRARASSRRRPTMRFRDLEMKTPTKLNKEKIIVNFRNVNFHEMLGNFFQFSEALRVNISTHFLITKGKLIQFPACTKQMRLRLIVQLQGSSESKFIIFLAKAEKNHRKKKKSSGDTYSESVAGNTASSKKWPEILR